jgi:hypothetical protein
MALFRRHESFEDPAEHVGCDLSGLGGLVHREMEPLEYLVEGVAPAWLGISARHPRSSGWVRTVRIEKGIRPKRRLTPGVRLREVPGQRRKDRGAAADDRPASRPPRRRKSGSRRATPACEVEEEDRVTAQGGTAILAGHRAG